MSQLWTLVILAPSSNTKTAEEIVFSPKKALEYQTLVCKKHFSAQLLKKFEKFKAM